MSSEPRTLPRGASMVTTADHHRRRRVHRLRRWPTPSWPTAEACTSFTTSRTDQRDQGARRGDAPRDRHPRGARPDGGWSMSRPPRHDLPPGGPDRRAQGASRTRAHDADVNIIGTINVLEAARAVGARVVFASTGGAGYGEYEGLPRPDARDRRDEAHVARTARARWPARVPAPLRPSPRRRDRRPAARRTSTDRARTRTARPAWWRSSAACCSRGARRGSSATARQTRDYVYVGDVVEAFLAAEAARPARRSTSAPATRCRCSSSSTGWATRASPSSSRPG